MCQISHMGKELVRYHFCLHKRHATEGCCKLHTWCDPCRNRAGVQCQAAVRASSTLAPPQIGLSWLTELTHPQFPQEDCHCFPLCLYPKYFQFTQDINSRDRSRALVHLQVGGTWLTRSSYPWTWVSPKMSPEKWPIQSALYLFFILPEHSQRCIRSSSRTDR